MIPKPEKRICPYSATEFIPKRSNQIFATNEFRIAFHNNINNTTRKKLSDINNRLAKNYKTLVELVGKNKEIIIHKEFLKGKSFSFKVFTHLIQHEGGFVYGIYDYSFFKIDADNYKITKI